MKWEDFTPKEQGQIGRYFPGVLFKKFCEYLRDWLLASSALTEKIREIVDERIKALPAPTVPKMTKEEEKEARDEVTEIVRTTLAKVAPSRQEFDDLKAKVETLSQAATDPAQTATTDKSAVKKDKKIVKVAKDSGLQDASAEKTLSVLAEFAKEE